MSAGRNMAAAWGVCLVLSPHCPAPWVGCSAHVLGMAVVVMSHPEQDTADKEASLLRQLQEQWLFYHQEHLGREGRTQFPSWLLAQFHQQGENLSSGCGGYPQGYDTEDTAPQFTLLCQPHAAPESMSSPADTHLVWTVPVIICLENCQLRELAGSRWGRKWI